MALRTDPARGDVVLGTNQSMMRAHNERLVLSLLRRHGPLPKAEIARASGLSAQTVSVIMRALESDGLLARGEPLRGRVGQPSVPMRLAADGAYFLGLKIGRRSADMVMIDFLGQVLGRVYLTYRHPAPEATMRFALDAIDQLRGQLPGGRADRLAGLGIAMPFRLWDWAGPNGGARAGLDGWRGFDIRAELAARLDFPVFVENDASAACGAELVFGTGERPRDFLYFYIGYFVGGGVVLNGRLFTGQSGNAGALGSIPQPGRGSGGTRQLVDIASLGVLERALERKGLPTASLWQPPAAWDVDAAILSGWIDEAAAGLAFAIAAGVAVIDTPEVMIDGWIPAPVRRALVARTEAALGRLCLAGIAVPLLREGSIGPDARSLGAASLPLSERYLLERDG